MDSRIIGTRWRLNAKLKSEAILMDKSYLLNVKSKVLDGQFL